ncbi:conserved exported hypothetical protein [Cupriavidus taiwanensis]|nr:conserved exported hypothetical protein [Cupriavidus taiwanensis]
MGRTSRYQVIKRMQAEMPRGASFCLSALSRLGISAQLAAQYVASGWLVRLAHGVYAYPNDDFNVYDALLFLQKLVPGLHVGGKTALGWQGVMHSVSSACALG